MIHLVKWDKKKKIKIMMKAVNKEKLNKKFLRRYLKVYRV